MVFTVCCEPYLQSEYGADYVSDSPVKLLDRLLHGQRQIPDEQVRALPAAEPLCVWHVLCGAGEALPTSDPRPSW